MRPKTSRYLAPPPIKVDPDAPLPKPKRLFPTEPFGEDIIPPCEVFCSNGNLNTTYNRSLCFIDCKIKESKTAVHKGMTKLQSLQTQLHKTLAWVEKSDDEEDAGNKTISIHEADLLQSYLKRELNYTSRVVLNSLRNKMYWFKVAKRMHRAADTQKESDTHSARMKLFLAELERLQIAVLKMKQRHLDAKIALLTRKYAELSGKDASDLQEDKVAMGILQEAAACRATAEANMTSLAPRLKGLAEQTINATSTEEREA